MANKRQKRLFFSVGVFETESSDRIRGRKSDLQKFFEVLYAKCQRDLSKGELGIFFW